MWKPSRSTSSSTSWCPSSSSSFSSGNHSGCKIQLQKYTFQTGARFMQNTNTNTYSRLEHPHFGVGGGEERAGLAKVEASENGPRQVMSLSSRHIYFMERVDIFFQKKVTRTKERDGRFYYSRKGDVFTCVSSGFCQRSSSPFLSPSSRSALVIITLRFHNKKE